MQRHLYSTRSERLGSTLLPRRSRRQGHLTAARDSAQNALVPLEKHGGDATAKDGRRGREARPTARRAARALLSGKWTAGRRSDERAARPGHVKEAPRCVLSTRSPSKPSPRGAVVTDGLGEDQAFMMTRVRRHNRPHDEPRGAVRHMEGATGGSDGRRRRRPDGAGGDPGPPGPFSPPPAPKE